MKFLIDENLPDCLKIWSSSDFLHVTKISKSIPDTEIWQFAVENNLIIITKDTDSMKEYYTEIPRQKLF